MILEKVYSDFVSAEFLIPYEKGNVVSYFMEHGQIISQKYQEMGTLLCTKCHKADRDKYRQFLV